MPRVLQSQLILLVLAVVAGLSGGCAAAGVGLGVAYAKGNLETMVPGTPGEVTAATKSALDEMGYEILEIWRSGSDITVLGRTLDDRRLRLRIEDQDNGVSKLSIRIATFGKKMETYEIYDRIRQHLVVDDRG